MGKTSSDFDWVAERLKCSLNCVFESLRIEVESDVKARNKQLAAGVAVFEMASGSGQFTVFRKTGRYENYVRFEQTEVSIKVIDPTGSYSDPKVIANATLTLNNDGECRLRVGDEELELWQFRRTALESIFFNLNP